MRKFILIFFTLFVFASDNYAQHKEQLLNIYAEWLSFKENHEYENAHDQLVKFKSSLMLALEEDYSAALEAINELIAKEYEITLLQSPDEQVSIISWEEGHGGTMRVYDGVYFYKTTHGKGRVLDKYPSVEGVEDFGGSLPYGLYQVQDVNQKYIYILFEVSIGSSANSFHQVKTISIDNYVLNPDAKYIKTQSGLVNSIHYEVDWSVKSMRNSNLDREDERMTFNNITQTILLPLIQADGKLTKQKIAYKFNGKVFEKIGK